MPINVLHVIQGKHFGGAEQVVYVLAKCFEKSRVLPTVVCLSEGLLLKKLREAHIPSFFIPMRSKRDILLPIRKTVRLIKERDIDIVHTHTVRSNLIGRPAAFISGRRCITHLHSPILRDFADLRRGRINEIIDSLTRPLADRYISVSRSLREEMILRKMPADRIVAIHNALDLESLGVLDNGGDNSNGGIRKEFNIPSDVPLIVVVALLRPRKGVDVLIKAMGTVFNSCPRACLLIVGSDDISEDPQYGVNLRVMASDLGIEDKIIFTGFRNDVPAILRESDLMVLPSRFGEGLPMVILEAMAIGVPVVASGIEGIPEVIEDGISGFLVEPEDVGGLSDRILQVLQAPAMLKGVADRAKKKVLTELDGNTQARKIEEVYREVLACQTPL